jgi:hypothetical protein
MSKVVLYMSMSVDGFITGPDDGMDHGLGVNGERLHDCCAPAASIRVRTGPSTNPAQPCSTN